MPTDWTDKVRDAITNLEINTDRVLKPAKALAIIDDVVAGKFAAAELATVHGIPRSASGQRSDTSRGRLARAASGRSRPAAGMPSRGMNTLTRWPRFRRRLEAGTWFVVTRYR
jgi:hypothetical protein